MAPITNGRELFNAVGPFPGKTTVYDMTETIDFETLLLNGGFLKLSIDPFLFPSMRAPQKNQAVPPFAIGKPGV
ncbi:hypothetical protein C8F04DRAFT_1276239 [Mycena alexandri]|uniref:Uncharacterized protein n=1 Tax=Mycena alexandri TaxID=1745969 RepID=A0AAD6WNJ0_9AGAR|nr:hypothetical protein C8F04DRAFT_1278536 [Mycena alexandri]KAJ7019423.1 hypothetical protein C8F04DRAFT_1276239 [Mycena alexandri]